METTKLYSQQLTIFHIIREYKKICEYSNGFGQLGMSTEQMAEIIKSNKK